MNPLLNRAVFRGSVRKRPAVENLAYPVLRRWAVPGNDTPFKAQPMMRSGGGPDSGGSPPA